MLQEKRGFTLIELIVVIAIISILAAIVYSTVSQYIAKSRNVARKETLKVLQKSLEAYYADNGYYPITQFNWYSSEAGDGVSDNGGNWIPGLAPDYISSLPRDPLKGADASSEFLGCAGWKAAFLYMSNDDGSGYKLLSHCAVEGTMSPDDPFYDPARPIWAWMVCHNPPGAPDTAPDLCAQY